MTEDLLKQLQSSLVDAKSKLKSATESLNKLHGQANFKRLQDRKRSATGQLDSENAAGNANTDASGIPTKRVHANSQPKRPESRPIPTVPLEEFQRARREAIKEQKALEDSELRARNRRMFGVMLGTLKQFSAAERDRERQESYQHRREVEQRVEESVRREQERLQREVAELSNEKKRRQAEIVALETQMRLVESHAAWRQATEHLRGSIRTLADSHPHRLYYRPRIFCDRAKRRRELSSRQIDAEISERERRLRQEIDRALRQAADAPVETKKIASDSANNKVAMETKEKVSNSASNRPEPVKRLLSSVAVVVTPQSQSQPQSQQQQQSEDAIEKPSSTTSATDAKLNANNQDDK